MQIKRIDLYEYFGLKRPENGEGYLNVYTKHYCDEYNSDVLYPAMMVIPGGGYGMRSDREKEPIALAYLTRGFNTFTLDYSVAPVTYPAQLIEGAMAIAYIKLNYYELRVRPDKVCAVGFSAGGHLCGMLATLFEEKVVKDALKDKAHLCRPDAVVLAYPVITLGEKTHQGTMDNLTGDDKKLREYLALENRVTKDSSPAFIWCTADDAVVPSENSLLMATAYKKKDVPFELHIYNKGPHGLSLCVKETVGRYISEPLVNPHVAKWVEVSDEWLKDLGFEQTVADKI